MMLHIWRAIIELLLPCVVIVNKSGKFLPSIAKNNHNIVYIVNSVKMGSTVQETTVSIEVIS